MSGDVNEDEDLANALSINVSEIARIPKDLRGVLLARLLSKEDQSAREKHPSFDPEPSTSSYQPEIEDIPSNNVDCGDQSKESTEVFESDQKLEDEDDIQKQFEAELPYDFPTATDALASEAAFMENIGLYLNPRQAIAMGRGAPSTRERTASDCLEAADILFWCDQSTDLVESPAKGGVKPSQQSLLSFLNKTKTGESEERTAAEASQSASVKWRLWNPEQEVSQDELWNDIFTSANEYIAAETSDPTLMEMSHQSNDPEKMPSATETSTTNTKNSDYFCKPCGRSLCSSEALYRHSLSELHFKRTSMTKTELKIPAKRKETKQATEATSNPKNEPKKLKPMNCCPSCNASVPDGCMGKHLVSHFHHHRSIGHPMHSKLILDHIHDIIKQAPFQCHLCYFYCNLQRQFKQHWQDQHGLASIDCNLGYWCSACRIICKSEIAMNAHLSSETHLELVAMINRSVAIVIKRVQMSQCSTCSKRFRLTFNLKRHMLEEHGQVLQPSFIQITCKKCGYKAINESKLKEHKFLAHKNRSEKAFSCLLCRKSFKSKYAAQSHKMSREHLQNGKNKVDNCVYCGEELDMSSLDDHLKSKHVEDLSQCHLCGEIFVLPQKLGSHLRRGKCRASTSCANSSGLNDDFACNVRPCPFVGKSHELLTMHLLATHSSKSPWHCPRCSIDFQSRVKLQRHLMTHRLPPLQQKSRCSKCSASFLTQLALQSHLCCISNEQRTFSCSECDYSCSKNADLKSHLLTHKAPGLMERHHCPQCNRSFLRRSELNRHVGQVHSGAKAKIQCSSCDYATFSRQHLNRHLLAAHKEDEATEDGIRRRYFCRLCEFSSGSLDNLRKHILRTSKHPGCQIYQCHGCHFKSNSQMSFKSHLRREHPSEKADLIVANYFDERE